MFSVTLICVLLLVCNLNLSQASQPDLDFNTEQMIRFRGFQPESYDVITDDCYILKLYRIVVPNMKPNRTRPVLIQHGLFGSSDDFMMNTAGGRLNDSDNHNLVFYLVKNGFDVWLSNVRGNKYSRAHVHLNPDTDTSFWKFTYDQHAENDLPAIIGFIQNQTQTMQVSYVGYSQGTLSMFQLLAQNSPLNAIVRPFAALAPVATVGHARSPFKYLRYNFVLVDYFINHPNEYLDNNLFNKIISKIICRGFNEILCENIVFLLVGFDSQQMDLNRLPVYLNHMPSGTSRWNLAHYAQAVGTDRMNKFDAGSKTNKCLYGQKTPPAIDLSKISTDSIHLFYSDNDWLADPTDVESLKETLKVNYTSTRIPLSDWNHMDFMTAMETDTLLNPNVLSALLKYDKEPIDKNTPQLPLYTAQSCSMNKCLTN